MKVRDLILQLQSMDPEAEVVTPNGDVGGQFLLLEEHEVVPEYARVAEWSEDILVPAGESYEGARKVVIVG